MIIVCKNCGHNNRIIDIKSQMYDERCSNCGRVIFKGKYRNKNWYCDYLKSEHWITTSRLAQEHYGNKCTRCSETKNLQTHHKSYANIGKEKLSDLDVLCKKCHKEEHTTKKIK